MIKIKLPVTCDGELLIVDLLAFIPFVIAA